MQIPKLKHHSAICAIVQRSEVIICTFQYQMRRIRTADSIPLCLIRLVCTHEYSSLCIFYAYGMGVLKSYVYLRQL